ncbi:MAG: hypothetical protein M3281_04780 [Chloroflexota bacterium]|nr:hypothetical protein [Chloroflexota bacterium]
MTEERTYALKAARIEDGTVAYAVEGLTLQEAERTLLVWWGEMYADRYELYYEEESEPGQELALVDRLRVLVDRYDAGELTEQDLEAVVVAIARELLRT